MQFLSSVVMINFYILLKRFFLKRKILSDAGIVSITKKTRFCGTFFAVKDIKVFKVNI